MNSTNGSPRRTRRQREVSCADSSRTFRSRQLARPQRSAGELRRCTARDRAAYGHPGLPPRRRDLAPPASLHQRHRPVHHRPVPPGERRWHRGICLRTRPTIRAKGLRDTQRLSRRAASLRQRRRGRPSIPLTPGCSTVAHAASRVGSRSGAAVSGTRGRPAPRKLRRCDLSAVAVRGTESKSLWVAFAGGKSSRGRTGTSWLQRGLRDGVRIPFRAGERVAVGEQQLVDSGLCFPEVMA